MDASERETGFRGRMTRWWSRLKSWNYRWNEWQDDAAAYLLLLLISLVYIVLGGPFIARWRDTAEAVEARDAQISLFVGFWLGVGATLMVVWLM